MTRAEKVAQLGSLWAFEVVPESGFDAARLAALGADGIGQITRLAGSTNLRPIEVAETANAIQRYLVEETRLGHPDHHPRGMPARPHRLGGALFPAVDRRRRELRPRRGLGDRRHDPPADAPDRRPPRARARSSTSPATLAGAGSRRPTARTRTSRPSSDARTSRRSRVPTSPTASIATAKHMVGHGLAEGGMNQAPAHVGERELRDEQLFPFEAAVRRSGIASVMPAYCDVDGVPCHASAALLTGILREEWGFDGIVASDYIGVEMISTAHKLTADLGEAARLALAGRRRRGAAADRRVRPAARGRPRGRPGRARPTSTPPSRAILRMKFRLGLFERPVRPDPGRGGPSRRWPPTRRAPPASLADRSLVLVKNDGILPLDRRPAGAWRSSGRSPTAPATCSATTATWSTWRPCARCTRASDALGIVGEGDVIAPADELTGRRTILDALRDVARRRRRPLRARHRHLRRDRRGDRRGGRGRERVRGRDPGPRRALRPDRRLDHRRVPRPLDSRLPRPPAGAARRRRRDRHAGRARGRQRPATRHRIRSRALPRGPPRVGARRRRPGCDRGRADRGREPGRQAPDLDPAARRAGAGDVPAPPDGRPLAAQGRLRRRVGHAALAVRVRAVVHDVQGRPAAPRSRRELATDGGELADQRRRHEHRRPGRRRGRPALRPRRGGQRSPVRSASCAASAA